MESKRLAWVLLALWGCATSSAVPKPPESSEPGPGVVFVEDDYGAALRLAREKHKPLLVEGWAPWCLACRSMRATVFKAPELSPYADRFQWVAVDISNPLNEDFLRRFPVETLPLVLVLEPENETLLARSIGTMSAPQLVELLTQAERAFHRGLRETEERIARAHALATTGEHEKAVESYQQALSQLAPEEPLRAGVVVSLIKSLVATHKPAECMRLAARELSQLSRASDQAQVLYTGGGCALDVDTAEAGPLRAILEEETARAIQAPTEALPPNMRSSLYESLVELRSASGQEAKLPGLLEEWFAFLETTAKRARSAEERAALDSHRMMVAMMLEKPERAIPALQRSERELPGDYNPPAQLALLHLQAGQLEQALQASDRALARVKGGGRGMVLADRARILLARGERAQAERMLTGALRELEGAPAGTVTSQQQKALERALKFVRASGG
ncbi:thioredoxin family protein [Myxococcaceae bacterium GXIMD 01537]